MKFNERLNPFLYGFFTNETEKASQIFFIQIDSYSVSAKFLRLQGKLPQDIDSNMPIVPNFKHNDKDGTFTSDIGNGTFVITEKRKMKMVFDNYIYDNMPKLELHQNITMNNNKNDNNNEFGVPKQ